MNERQDAKDAKLKRQETLNQFELPAALRPLTSFLTLQLGVLGVLAFMSI
jgi:hypothetical protein